MSLPTSKDFRFIMLKSNLKEQIRRGNCRPIDVGVESALGLALRQGQWLLYRMKADTALQIDAQATLAAWRALPTNAGVERLWRAAKLPRAKLPRRRLLEGD